MKKSRRKFLQQSAAGLGAISLTAGMPLSALAQNKKVSPNEKINYGVIGCKGMGWSNMRSHLLMDEVDCIALCDVDQNVLDERAGNIMEARGHKPKLYKDYRKLLENKDIDAIVIGTPDHWHCLPMLEALEAGKHVYVEKPVANTIQECQIMMEAAKKSDRIIQVGQWQRSGTHYETAIKLVKSGKLGNIRLVKVWAYQGWMKPVPVVADSAAPEGVDYDMWLGPAPKRAFNKNRFHFQLPLVLGLCWRVDDGLGCPRD